jgi:hypothetical protein
MRVLVLDGRIRRASEPLIGHVAAYLGRFGIELERVRFKRKQRHPYEEYAALICTTAFPIDLRARLDCYGKTQTGMPSRPETMEWLREAGLPVMRWSLASDLRELEGLFDRWQTNAVLLKPSGTMGGTSVSLFIRDCASEIEWNPRMDLFCPEVNPDDGDVYKLEMFGSTVLLGWMSRVPPARSRMSGGFARGLVGAYGVRELFDDWPEAIVKAARTFGEFALDRGYGHISLDLMRNRDGQFEAIEVNLGNVALWWTTQFRSFRRQYARAVHGVLIERNGASSSPAGASVRAGNWISGLVEKPRLLLREIQSARFRSRYTAELESQHAPDLRPTNRR